MWLSILEVSFIRGSARATGEHVDADAIALVASIFALIVVSSWSCPGTATGSLPFEPVSRVSLAVWPGLDAEAVGLAVNEFPPEYLPIYPRIQALSVFLVCVCVQNILATVTLILLRK